MSSLDRTNYVQDVISSLTLSRFLASIGSPLQSSASLWAAHRELWADNGDRLSKIYAGTGALNTSATRSGKKTFAGLLSDATKSVGRAYINNFQDKGKQNAIDMLLRPVILFDPISDSVQAALSARVNEYSSPRIVTIFSGTWNLNGKVSADQRAGADRPQAPDEALDDWLFPSNVAERMWEKYIMDTFAMRKGGSDYLLFRSEQTGLSGLSGNKGGVGIRFQLFDTSVCFVTSHLTAGHSNVTERNADWKTLTNGMRFLRGKMVEDHDIIIWSADLVLRNAAEAGDLDSMLAADQLLNAVDAGETFIGYDEGPIRFKPTDNGTDQYDTSEKQRIPAWTDRVLFRGSALRLKEYNRAELMTSDHRPVYALFDATIREVDHTRKDAISKEIVHSLVGSGGKVDTKVERALARGGIDDMVNGLTKAAPSSASRPQLPPRPSSAASMKEALTSSPVTANGRMHSASISNGITASSSLRALASGPSNASRRAPPPIPSRPTVSSLVSQSQNSTTTPLSPDRRGSPLPRTSQTITAGTASPSRVITPLSTGDFVVVPSSDSSPSAPNGRQAPPLPPRAVPTPKASMEQVKPAAKPAIPRKPVPSELAGVTNEAGTEDSRPSLASLRSRFEQPEPKSPTKVQSTSGNESIADTARDQATIGAGVAKNSPGQPAVPPKPRRLSSNLVLSATTVSPDGKKPPVIPKKPDGLKGGTQTAR
ncbi:hypothetical protein IAU60_006873 [Kwoniella sp. DSM 27419]